MTKSEQQALACAIAYAVDGGLHYPSEIVAWARHTIEPLSITKPHHYVAVVQKGINHGTD